ncbi:MAG: endonuclease III [Eubacteriales bacterium]|nr:endonuclease III [Eubacteriales bacterium]MDD4389191.1 endonuclease III [Eubacteriales bacterium]
MKKHSALLTKKQALEVIDILDKTYPEAECELDFENLFQLLIAVVLSAQTTDKSVNKVTPELFKRYPDACSMSEAGQGNEADAIEEISQIIKRIGMYKTKAKNILGLSKILCNEYGGKVPDRYDELILLPGVGRKTANVVLSVGFGQQRIAVDTHVFRVSNRIGLANEKDVLKTEMALMEIIPEERWSATHHNLIFHGRYCCDARKPKCFECSIYELCKWEQKAEYGEN